MMASPHGGGGGVDLQKLLMLNNQSNPPPPSHSYPPPHSTTPFHPQYLFQQQQQQQQQPNPPPNPNPNNLEGARLMALLTTPPPPPPPSTLPHSASAPPPLPTKKKLPKGRFLPRNSHLVYDVDVRLQGESQPQLEVAPITKYVSDPALVLGRQIAVNSTYICYGLKLGAIRILNINTATRALLKGHSHRVTDMAFFREEVHLLASVSVDGKVFVWKINEEKDEQGKPLITGHIILHVQILILGEGLPVHPRVCWHSHKQEYLVVGIGKNVLKIDMTRVGKGETVSAEEPIVCPISRLIDGVQLVGTHDGEVTDLSMCQWMTTRLVSASTDGTVKIWEDRRELPLVVLRPHDGQPVYAAIFLTATDRPSHINLITAGPLNREVKIWASTSEEGWLLPSDAESWQCTQIMDLRSSAEPRMEEAFFNQVLALPRAGLVLLANAKKNAIYAVHIEYGPNPAATHMDYIAEFTVTMPILSLTGTSECSASGEHVVQVYCVQTQAIQQYALDLCQCLPTTTENMGLEKSESGGYRDFDTFSSDGLGSSEPLRANASSENFVLTDAPKPPMLVSRSESALIPRYPASSGVPEFPSTPNVASSYLESRQTILTPVATDSNYVRVASPLPLSPRISGFRSPSKNLEFRTPSSVHAVDQPTFDYSGDRKVDTVPSLHSVPSWEDNLKKGDKESIQNDSSMVQNPPVMFKHPTHLITPSEILSRAVSSSENTQMTEGMNGDPKVVISSETEGVNVVVKVVGETGSINKADIDSQRGPQMENAFYSQASSLNLGTTSECCALPTETISEAGQADDAGVSEALNWPQSALEEEVLDSTEDAPQKVSESATGTTVPEHSIPVSKGRKQKAKVSQVSDPSSPSPYPFNGAPNEPDSNSGVPSMEAVFSQILSNQDQLLSTQKEMQNQMASMFSVPVMKEGKRLEASLSRGIEKSIRANIDALWARFQEASAKSDKLQQERTQQITSYISNCLNKDLPALLERLMKKELASLGQAVARLVTTAVEKSISSSITESFQRGVGDKAVAQLEKSVTSKLEGTLARQLQVQFQTSGKQALQDALKSSMEASVIPAFEVSCKAMFEQIDVAFQKGMVEHTAAAHQKFDATHSTVALALREAIGSASSITQTLTGELADGQRKILALAEANSKAVNPLVTQLSSRPIGGIHEIAMPVQHVEAPVDPTKELSRLISERKFGEAFTAALQRSDVSIVSWLCSQVDLQGILQIVPPPLSQGVLLALLQQLACDISNDPSQKLIWMRDVAVAINPADPMIASHVRPIFEQVYQILGHQCGVPTSNAADTSSMRLVMHVINSILTSCK